MPARPPAAVRPEELTYAVDDLPPFPTLVLLGLQQVAVISIYLVLAVVVVRAAGAPPRVAESVVSLTMIALGVGAALQAMWRGPIGSGYLAPPVSSAIYLQPSIVAAHEGGLPLVFGMTIFAGLFESGCSRLLRRLRRVFPPLLGGIVMIVVGLQLGLVGVQQLLDIVGRRAPGFETHVALSGFTLITMVGLAVWASGVVRMLCSLLGLVAGTAAAYLAGIIPGEAINRIADAPFFGLPNAAHIGYAFHPVLAIPFAVSAVAAALRTIGVVTTSQQINNSNWTRPDPESTAGGVLADGLGCAIGGLLGAAPGTSSSPSAVGVAKATGATSRYIALAICGWFIVLACMPKLAAGFLAFPSSVVGAGLVFSGSFITVSGVKIIAAHDFDARRTFTIGIPLFLALGQEAFRSYFEGLPSLLRSITDSMLSIATVGAILLNLVFRIGRQRSYAVEVRLADGSRDALAHGLLERGKKWGIGPDVVRRAEEASSQILDLIQDRRLADGPVRATVSFDDDEFIVDVAYHGTALHLPPHRPNPKELVEEEAFSSGLAGYLVGVHPDRVQVAAKDSECHIRLEFWS